MSHEFKDFNDINYWNELMKDPRYPAYAAGFEKAKEIFTARKEYSQLSFITGAVDYFVRWKETQDAGDQRVALP